MATKEDLKLLQNQSLQDKIQRSLGLISEWYAYYDNQCYVSFSGGKDSTVLADIAAKWCSIAQIPLYLVFADTGLEFPEVKQHVHEYADYLRQKYNIEVVLEILRPKMTFCDVIAKYGYPVIGKRQAGYIRLARQNLLQGKYSIRLKYLGMDEEEAQSLGLIMPDEEMLARYKASTDGSKYRMANYKPLLFTDFILSEQCCDIMKKEPMHRYSKKFGRMPITGQMTEESSSRENTWMKNGCNAFNAKNPISNPLSFWTEQDILHYIKTSPPSHCRLFTARSYLSKDRMKNYVQRAVTEPAVCIAASEHI